jgi:outer membrane protein TolC
MGEYYASFAGRGAGCPTPNPRPGIKAGDGAPAGCSYRREAVPAPAKFSGNKVSMRAVRSSVALAFLTLTLVAPAGAQSERVPAANPVVIPASPQSYSGSVPLGTATPEPLALSLKDALERGLKQNLGPVLTGYGIGGARGQRWQDLANLLPNVRAQVSENAAQVNVAATFGFRFAGFPMIIGPFGYFQTGATLDQTLFSWARINQARSGGAALDAAKFSYDDARDIVVLGVGNAYLLCVAGAARVDTAVAQEATAQALYDLASDQFKAGLAPAIDVLRAQTELQSRKQLSIVARNDYAKELLQLGRVIGLPPGQQVTLTDKALYGQPVSWSVQEALDRAYLTRSDYKSARASMRAAELAEHAARAEYLPNIGFTGDYGIAGVTPGSTHGIFDASVRLNVPIFEGNRVHGDVLVAQAAYNQAKATFENLRGQIDYDVRAAFLDLEAAKERVAVAKINKDLADQTLEQSQDRFRAGVTNNVEVVQAQDQVASANESLISSLYAYDLAKITLARAVGNAEMGVADYLKGK